MSAEPKTIQIDPGSELGRLLEDAADTGILLEKEGVLYRLIRIEVPDSNEEAGDLPERGRNRTGRSATDARTQQLTTEPLDDPLLGLIGLLDGGEPSDIARFKDQYIADAVDRRD